jgi:3D (Asp-Asp-Asp) domain-containing protein
MIRDVIYVVTMLIAGILLWVSNVVYQDQINLNEALTDQLSSQQKDIVLQSEKITFQNSLLKNIFGFIPTKSFTKQVTATAYSAEVRQCDSTPETTAFNNPTRMGIIALSRDLLSNTSMGEGSVVIVSCREFSGVFIVDDKTSTHKRKDTDHPVEITNQIDVLHANEKAALLFGVKQNVTLTWVR